jgi:hypothetical protein
MARPQAHDDLLLRKSGNEESKGLHFEFYVPIACVKAGLVSFPGFLLSSESNGRFAIASRLHYFPAEILAFRS